MGTILFDKIQGSLAAGCIADALGAPTEELSYEQIRAAFDGYVEDFHAPLPGAPYAKGRKAAQITDDSSQMMMLAELLAIKGSDVTPEDIAALLVEWSGNPSYYPHFAGPTTRAAIEQLSQGADPRDVGRAGNIMSQGASNGAAMRVGPVGLLHHGDPQAAARTAFITCVPSHNTSAGVAGAAAIASAVAAACRPGVGILSVVRAAQTGARVGADLGRTEGRIVPAPSVERRIAHAASLAISSVDDEDAIHRIVDQIGVGLPAAEAVPAAVGFFVAADGDPLRAAKLAANAGGDSDTIGCMAASIAGAYTGLAGIDKTYVHAVEQANELDITAVAQRLYAKAISA